MSLRKKAFSGLFWTYLQQFSNQGVNFIITLILARILMPSDFGIMGLMYVFIAIGNALIDGGLSQSLIRTKDANIKDYNTVFFSNLLFSGIVYGITFFCAPFIQEFYQVDGLATLIRVFSLTFLLTAFSSVQNALLVKEMKFRIQMMISLPSLIISGIVGVILAYYGFGVWSLVWATLVKSFVNTVQLWMYNNWIPSLNFDFPRFKNHFNFGYKLALVSIMDSIFLNIYPIIIGKFFHLKQVGLYTQAETVKQLPVSNVTGAIAKITFPLFAEIQDDNQKLKMVFKKVTEMVLAVLCPVLVMMGVLADSLLEFLFSEKWIEAAPFLTILCFASILPIVNTYNVNILKIRGKSNLLLMVEVFNKLIIVLSIFLFFKLGVLAIVFSKVISSVFSYIVNSYYCGKELNFSLLNQIKSMLPILLISFVAGSLVFITKHYVYIWTNTAFIRLMILGLIGGLSYFSLMRLFQKKIINEFATVFRNVRAQRNQ